VILKFTNFHVFFTARVDLYLAREITHSQFTLVDLPGNTGNKVLGFVFDHFIYLVVLKIPHIKCSPESNRQTIVLRPIYNI